MYMWHEVSMKGLLGGGSRLEGKMSFSGPSQLKIGSGKGAPTKTAINHCGKRKPRARMGSQQNVGRGCIALHAEGAMFCPHPQHLQ